MTSSHWLPPTAPKPCTVAPPSELSICKRYVSKCDCLYIIYEKKNYAGSENRSPHWLRKRKSLGTEYRKTPLPAGKKGPVSTYIEECKLRRRYNCSVALPHWALSLQELGKSKTTGIEEQGLRRQLVPIIKKKLRRQWKQGFHTWKASQTI
jgi:hypothetical protein